MQNTEIARLARVLWNSYTLQLPPSAKFDNAPRWSDLAAEAQERWLNIARLAVAVLK